MRDGDIFEYVYIYAYNMHTYVYISVYSMERDMVARGAPWELVSSTSCSVADEISRCMIYARPEQVVSG